jgi:integrase
MKMPTAAELKTVAGETNRTLEEAKGKILELCMHLKRQGYADETIRLHHSALKVLLNRGAHLFDEGSVKDVIARQTWSDNRRRNVINAYGTFLKHNGKSWEKPKCVVTQKIPFCPTEEEIDSLISSAGRKLSAFLQLLKETAMRRGEAKRLQWTDVDNERTMITLNAPEKHSNARMWKVSSRLMAMLNQLPKTSQRVFGDSKMDSMKSMFLTLRKKQAAKLQNPRLMKINFHSFRHWKATMLMHQTRRDIYYVQRFLGHRSIKNTELYLHMENIIFGESSNDEFTVKVVEKDKPDEIKALLELGFDPSCQTDNHIFLRKHK